VRVGSRRQRIGPFDTLFLVSEPDLHLELLGLDGLLDPRVGFRLFDALDRLVPEWAPARWDTDEPVRKPWPPDDFAVAWRAGNDLLTTSQAPGTAEFKVGKRLGRGSSHSDVVARARMAKSDPAHAVALLKEAAELVDADYGHLHFEPGSWLFWAARDLEGKGLRPRWALVLGPAYVSMFGADEIASAPAHVIERLSPERFYVQLTPEIADRVERPEVYERAVRAFVDHLGGDAFYDVPGRTGIATRRPDFSELRLERSIDTAGTPIPLPRVEPATGATPP
jgi:hypothetical protein